MYLCTYIYMHTNKYVFAYVYIYTHMPSAEAKNTVVLEFLDSTMAGSTQRDQELGKEALILG